MYDNSVVQIIFGNIETSIDFKVGFKQGNIMAPVIFLLLMIDFHKTPEDEWDDLVLIKCQFTHRDNSQISTGQLVIHQPETFVYRTLFDIFWILYVEDGAFVFESSTDIERLITLLSDQFDQFGLEIHIGTIKKTSNTGCIFFPAPGLFNAHTPPPTEPSNSNLALQKI